MVNKIWAFFLMTGILYGFFSGNITNINSEIFNSIEKALQMFLNLFPLITLWLGLMNVAKKSGLLKKLSNILKPLLVRIFPDIPKNHESFEYISSNIVANMCGLGSAATPFGLKAMQSLQELNKNKSVASRSMITFLVINTTSVTIVPTSVIALRLAYGSANPGDIILTMLIASVCSTFFGLLIDRLVASRCK